MKREWGNMGSTSSKNINLCGVLKLGNLKLLKFEMLNLSNLMILVGLLEVLCYTDIVAGKNREGSLDSFSLMY